ncbi:MAG: LCP family protein [Coriobacteriia bacterium]|nr:LCP family protein [Coriobacteriia bacterium]
MTSQPSSDHLDPQVEQPQAQGESQDMVTIRVRKKRRTKRRHEDAPKRRGLKVALIALGVVLAALLVSGLAVAGLVNAGKINLHPLFQGIEAPEEVESEDDGSVIEHKGHRYAYNENVVSALIIGYDDESGYTSRPDYSCADANLLLTMDTKTNRVKLCVIPRNSIVDLDVFKEDGSLKATRRAQLCLAYAQFPNTDKRAAENTLKSVSTLMYGMPLNHYFAFDEKGLVEATGMLGGVRVEALETIPGTPIRKGQEVLLQGENAWRYVSYRDIDVDESALDRQRRQIQFAQAFLTAARSGGAKGIMGMYDAVKSRAVTNLGASEIGYLVSCFASGKKVELETCTIKGRTKLATGSDGVELERYYLNDNSVLETVLDLFYTRID